MSISHDERGAIAMSTVLRGITSLSYDDAALPRAFEILKGVLEESIEEARLYGPDSEEAVELEVWLALDRWLARVHLSRTGVPR
jgi:hypothetical protein